MHKLISTIRILTFSLLTFAASFNCLAKSTSPSVLVSIKPFYNLCAAIMESVGEPKLLLSGNASPHDFHLKPSDMQSLKDADLIIWAGPYLESFMAKPIESLQKDKQTLGLMELNDIKLLPARTSAEWEVEHSCCGHGHKHHDHGHKHDEHKHEGHKHDSHKHHAHKHDEHKHHDHKHHEHDGHKHHEHKHEDALQTMDAHFWLKPDNAKVILKAIAAQLIQLDPENKTVYQKNLAKHLHEIEQLQQQLSAQLTPVSKRSFIVFHDAYQYFEQAFQLQAVGAVSLNPEVPPSAQRLQSLQDNLKKNNVVCVFSEPQFNDKLVKLLVQGTDVRQKQLDPLGQDIDLGPMGYYKMMRDLADTFAEGLAH